MNKFRKHIRYKNYNYFSIGDYFITLCSARFKHIFSKIDDDEVHLTPIGSIIDQIWTTMPARYTSTKLGAYVIMPNHFHGIVSITSEKNPINISNFVQQFKGTCTRRVVKYFKENNLNYKYGSIWQANFYEKIIRDEYQYYFIEQYILSNPANWEKDKLFKKNIGKFRIK